MPRSILGGVKTASWDNFRQNLGLWNQTSPSLGPWDHHNLGGSRNGEKPGEMNRKTLQHWDRHWDPSWFPPEFRFYPPIASIESTSIKREKNHGWFMKLNDPSTMIHTTTISKHSKKCVPSTSTIHPRCSTEAVHCSREAAQSRHVWKYLRQRYTTVPQLNGCFFIVHWPLNHQSCFFFKLQYMLW